jgi:uncharacterized protein YgbK (DUF1537 family)
VVADDMPGAAIAGSHLTAAGFRTAVVNQHSSWPEFAQAIVVDARSRDAAVRSETLINRPEDLVRAAADRLVSHQPRCNRFSLRIDAALRRDYSRDLDALIAGSQLADPVVVALPAYPDAGRITENGDQTAFVVRDRELTVPVSSRVFADQPSTLIPLSVVALGSEAVVEILAAGLRTTRRFVIDARTDADLRTIADACTVCEAENQLVTVSSGAWLSHFPTLDPRQLTIVAMGLPTNPNELQLEEILRDGDDSRERRRLVLVHEAVGLSLARKELERVAETSGTVIIKAASDSDSVDFKDAERVAAAEKVADAVASVLVSAHYAGIGCRGVLATGAFTAAKVAEALGANTIADLEEVTPLCTIGTISTGPWTGLRLAMKGGLVGGRTALAEALEQLEGRHVTQEPRLADEQP